MADRRYIRPEVVNRRLLDALERIARQADDDPTIRPITREGLIRIALDALCRAGLVELDEQGAKDG